VDLLSKGKMENYKTSHHKTIQLKLSRYIIIKLDEGYYTKNI